MRSPYGRIRAGGRIGGAAARVRSGTRAARPGKMDTGPRRGRRTRGAIVTAITEADLRARVRALIEEVDVHDRVAFRGAQYDRGLAWVHFPAGRGGLGLPHRMHTIVTDELRAWRGPPQRCRW